RLGREGVELDVLGQVELAVDVLEVLAHPREVGVALREVEFLPEAFVGELVEVSDGVGPRAGVAVPPPDAAESRRRVPDLDAEAKVAQAVELVETREPATNDEHVENVG